MIPEVGHFLTILGWTSALGLSIAGFIGGRQLAPAWVNLAIRLAKLQLIVLLGAFILLVISFLESDFSVLYVANNSNTGLPWYYKISAVWGAHEGSFLLWTLVCAVWTYAVAVLARHIALDIHGFVLGTLGALNTLFLAFLIISSNPFERLIPNVPLQGIDLNPLLQDVGLIIHPPMLYLGYVGFAVAFSFGIAALATGKLDSAWARWTRPWVNFAWMFLTVGIALGSWWAYYELGWGGWWFWDPVENASLMPWLAGAALIHSLAATEKRGAYKNWTVLLVIVTFSLSLVGAFLVRSGVLTSVHAFAVDSQRGLMLLGILVLVCGSAFVLFALRASTIQSRIQYWGLSRELLLLINNVLLTICVATIMLGTLYPLGYEWLTGGASISIGAPYFNRYIIPIALVLTACLALAPVSRWKHTPLALWRSSVIVIGVCGAVAFLLPWVLANRVHVLASCAIGLALWVLVGHVQALYRQRRSLTFGHLGMSVAHAGFAIAVIGIAVTGVFSVASDGRLAIGESLDVEGRSYELTEVEQITSDNFIAERAVFQVDEERLMYPERRFYPIRSVNTYEAAIHFIGFRDLYITLGDPIDEGSWGVRVQENVLVQWIWFGAFLMGIAACIACLDRRYKRLSQRDLTSQQSSQ